LLDDERESQDRTPGLSKIPVIKNLFRRKSVSRNSSEILFFITPRIYRSDYYGNPTDEAPTGTNRSMTILQPVPLGNPASNSEPQQQTPTPQKQGSQQPAVLPGTSPIYPGGKP
jgi:pilus assembly protein CpaC